MRMLMATNTGEELKLALNLFRQVSVFHDVAVLVQGALPHVLNAALLPSCLVRYVDR